MKKEQTMPNKKSTFLRSSSNYGHLDDTNLLGKQLPKFIDTDARFFKTILINLTKKVDIVRSSQLAIQSPFTTNRPTDHTIAKDFAQTLMKQSSITRIN